MRDPSCTTDCRQGVLYATVVRGFGAPLDLALKCIRKFPLDWLLVCVLLRSCSVLAPDTVDVPAESFAFGLALRMS